MNGRIKRHTSYYSIQVYLINTSMPKDQIGYKSREQLITETQLRLADGMVDVELDREHYDVAIDKALARYRQLKCR